MDTRFAKALKYLMDDEDVHREGKVIIDGDGRTRFGILERAHPELTARDFFDGMEHDEALELAGETYGTGYWIPINGAKIKSLQVATKLLDMAVNMGTHQARVYAQRAINHAGKPILKEDGVLGPKSLAAINTADAQDLTRILCELSANHYQHCVAVNPAKAVDLKGWLKRANRVPPVDPADPVDATEPADSFVEEAAADPK